MLFVFVTFLFLREISAVDRQCVPQEIDVCKSYAYAGFPNTIGHTTIETAKSEMKMLQPLIDSGCSADVETFLCSLYAPYCDPKNKTLNVEPCRDLCLNIYERCGKGIEERSAEWPNNWKCGRFSDWSPSNNCVKGNEARPTTKPPVIEEDATITPKKAKYTEGAADTSMEKDICTSEQFYCDNKCINLNFRCDDYDDCKDGTDEQNCDKCLSKQFRCSDGLKCISLSGKCDGYSDCADQSDEKDCNQCSGAEFLCDRTRCIPLSMKCDRNKDCTDGTDEMNCGECQPHEFKCRNNRCVSNSVVCDQSDDCGDNSDETLQKCNTIDYTIDTEDNEVEEDHMTCEKAKTKCHEADPECEKKATEYRNSCEKQMASDKPVECTKTCFNAYKILSSSVPYGKFLVDNKCKEMYVKNVEMSCVRQPASSECIKALQDCYKNDICKNLHETYSTRCDGVLSDHDICGNPCSDAYIQFIDSPLSKGIYSACVEVNTTMKQRCPQYYSRKDNAASPALLSTVVLLVLTGALIALPR